MKNKTSILIICTAFYLSGCLKSVDNTLQINSDLSSTSTLTTTSTTFTNLIWADEFNYSGNPDPTKWTYDLGWGTNGWGNLELESYTNSAKNSYVSNGTLKIVAIKERIKAQNYSSARIKTQGLFDFKYGRVEARIKVPDFVGGWPAFWMLGSDITTVGWPACGEIDIEEMVGRWLDTMYFSLHFPNHYGADGGVSKYFLPTAHTDFHVYSIDWDANVISWSIDGIVRGSYANSASIPFNKNFFLILNLAVGGNFGGDVDPNFTQGQMEVDYIRVYQ